MELSFNLPTQQDSDELIASLCSEDLTELLAQGARPEWAIPLSIENSVESVAIRIDGELACITGLVVESGLSAEVYPWLLGTDLMKKYPRVTMKYSRRILSRWQAEHPYMTNYVDARHKRAVKWLKALGARLELIQEHGLYKRPFYQFFFGSEPCA